MTTLSTPALNTAYYERKTPPCSHVLTGRETFVNADREVYVSCARCHATLDVIKCDTDAQASLAAMGNQRDPGIPF